jgi:hypothetical protein
MTFSAVNNTKTGSKSLKISILVVLWQFLIILSKKLEKKFFDQNSIKVCTLYYSIRDPFVLFLSSYFSPYLPNRKSDRQNFKRSESNYRITQYWYLNQHTTLFNHLKWLQKDYKYIWYKLMTHYYIYFRVISRTIQPHTTLFKTNASQTHSNLIKNRIEKYWS